jgi:hypothetical protein
MKENLLNGEERTKLFSSHHVLLLISARKGNEGGEELVMVTPLKHMATLNTAILVISPVRSHLPEMC